MNKSRKIIRSLVYKFLIATSGFQNARILSRIWNYVWVKSCQHLSGPIQAKIHGVSVVMNYGYTYPLYSKRFPFLNSPLVALVYRSYAIKRAPIKFVDVGAAVGDTILLLFERCKNMIEKVYAVEGDNEFIDYLTINLGALKQVEIYHAHLSSRRHSKARELVRTQLGTASAQGSGRVVTTTLDDILRKESFAATDVIKIDVDGSDGQVLLGARQLLRKWCPCVIFEWHPLLCAQTHNNWFDHFEALDESGYDRFIWFTKYGRFSHFMYHIRKDEISTLAALCERSLFEDDWHYDIVALHKNSELSPLLLAETEHFQRHQQPERILI